MYTFKKCCPFQSQHHTIVEVGGAFRGHLVSPSLVKQGHLKQVCPEPSEDGFRLSPRREIPKRPWVTCAQCLVTPTLLCSENPLCFSLGPLPLLLSPGITEKSLTSPSLLPPFRYWFTLMTFSLHLLFSRPNSPRPFLIDRCSSPFITFVDLWWILSNMPMSPLYWWAQNWTQDFLLVGPHQCWMETFRNFQASRNSH